MPDTFCFGQETGRTEGVSYNDITPRWSVAWDVFGNGKTAIKYNQGKYLQPANVGGIYNAINPVQAAWQLLRLRSASQWPTCMDGQQQ